MCIKVKETLHQLITGAVYKIIPVFERFNTIRNHKDLLIYMK